MTQFKKIRTPYNNGNSVDFLQLEAILHIFFCTRRTTEHFIVTSEHCFALNKSRRKSIWFSTKRISIIIGIAYLIKLSLTAIFQCDASMIFVTFK